MIEFPSKKEIDTISMDLLKQSKSIDIFPTPVNEILKYVQLRVDDKIDLSKVDKNYLSTLSNNSANNLKKSLKEIRGILDRKDKTIFLDLSQYPSRMNFVKLHEIGHEVLPWQNEFSKLLDDDLTLDFSCTEEFEAEANYFASTIFFQNDRFENELLKYPLHLNTPIQLSKKFGASIHATLRRYVEYSPYRCALLVLENVSCKGEQPLCYKRDLFFSNTFSQTFGAIFLPDELGYKWNFVRDYYFGKKKNVKGSLTLETENGIADFNYHFFNNSYNAFVLLFPF